jgi:hypothetical protein
VAINVHLIRHRAEWFKSFRMEQVRNKLICKLRISS